MLFVPLSHLSIELVMILYIYIIHFEYTVLHAGYTL